MTSRLAFIRRRLLSGRKLARSRTRGAVKGNRNMTGVYAEKFMAARAGQQGLGTGFRVLWYPETQR